MSLHLPATACFLQRPQGAQRRLLGIGEAPDARDIESLVESIASQCAQMLSTLEVPERDGSIIPATGQPAPIGTHLEPPDRPLMPLLHPHALPALHLPPARTPSLPPLTSTAPVGLQATAYTIPGCPARARTRSPPPEADRVPSRLQVTSFNLPSAPGSPPSLG